jgi:pimeloyl-ACP methyl ester carboxylesterase
MHPGRRARHRDHRAGAVTPLTGGPGSSRSLTLMTDLFVHAHDGTPLAVRDHGGSGPSVILLHGLGDHLLSVEQLSLRLAAWSRPVSMDLRWSGQSGSSSTFSWDVLVSDVEAVRAALDLGATFVVGHSLGGIVATHYGVAHPEAPGVANLDGWGFGDPDLYDGMERHEAEATIERLRRNVDPLAAFEREGDATWSTQARALLRRAAAAKDVDPADLDGWVDRMMLDTGEGRYRIRPDPVAYDSMRSDADVFGLLATTATPTLVVTSDVAVAANEVVASRRRGVAARLAKLCERNPNLSVTTIPGANHDSLVSTHVDEVTATLQQFALTRS